MTTAVEFSKQPAPQQPAPGQRPQQERQPQLDPTDPQLRPLPVWFFAFEGVIGGAFDLCHVYPQLWALVALLGVANLLLGLTVLGRRMKLLRAMLRNGRARRILFALIGLRIGVHVLLAAAGAATDSRPLHLALAVLMTAATITLLWFDQRVTFRTLGLGTTRAAHLRGVPAEQR